MAVHRWSRPYATPEEALQDLLTHANQNQAFARLWPKLNHQLRGRSAPGLTLTRLVQLGEIYGSRGLFYQSLETNPRTLELLLTLFDQSTYFTEIIHQQPELFEEVAASGQLHEPKHVSDYRAEIARLPGDPALALRGWLLGEKLRLFVRDVMNLAPLSEIEGEFTALAEACLQTAVEIVTPSGALAVIGLGRFGGRELTYGSALDCLILSNDPTDAEQISKFMSELSPSGQIFPLNFPLQSNGSAPACFSVQAAEEYLQQASFPEIVVLNRARFVTGNFTVASPFLDLVNHVWQQAGQQTEAAAQVDSLRSKIEHEQSDPTFPLGSFQTGRGGLLDIEYGLIRFLLARGHREPNQRVALDWLKRLHPAEAETWRQGLDFLRRIETTLSRDDCTIVSNLPAEEAEQEKLARRLGFPNAHDFLGEDKEQTGRIRAVYEQLGAL